jgi:hypothetical protein
LRCLLRMTEDHLRTLEALERSHLDFELSGHPFIVSVKECHEVPPRSFDATIHGDSLASLRLSQASNLRKFPDDQVRSIIRAVIYHDDLLRRGLAYDAPQGSPDVSSSVVHGDNGADQHD